MSSPVVAFCEPSSGRRKNENVNEECQLAAQPILPLVGQAEGVHVLPVAPRWMEFLVRPGGRYSHLTPLQFAQMMYAGPIGLKLDDIICCKVLDWLAGQSHPYRASINIHPGSLARPEFADLLLTELEATGINGQRICLELVEYGQMESPDRIGATVEKLQTAGVKLAIDDYGRGAPCFEIYGAGFIDYIKIDRGFVRDICTNPGHLALINGILSLANAVDAELIAEGIEHEEQAELLSGIGVHWGQGYLFERPKLVE